MPAADRLADPNPLLPQVVRLHHLDLLEQAERVRACLAALAEHAVGDPAQAARLQSLTQAGALEKRRYQESPPREEYVLTPKGHGLWPALRALSVQGQELTGNGPVYVFSHVACGTDLGEYGECARGAACWCHRRTWRCAPVRTARRIPETPSAARCASRTGCWSRG
ncbi:winged helix-turn-helix transcriptional regulator [Streptomyces sp. RB6PN25]|uniref:Winged helix-turn-helix transcriptional regulator n=1 Tax=Streptomyces humicola TaxID=2953240 RepID=A0ABT1PP04_9ACTN|nr:winged helix-turn-helix transcriptional regulator [Streptomyces humicola]MCQ4079401.1 winged helix-turn-helix transcriptional regulator [Streptomyces humicola]